ncbi:Crp/Fnr family transcriptional regulator [Bacillaceae bacterium S4-13-58]
MAIGTNESFLSRVEIFRGLSGSSLEFIESQIQTQSYRKGEFIFHETDEAKAIYFVNDGIVKIKKADQLGREMVICIKKKGDIFAEVSIFSDPGSTYPGTAVMAEAGTVSYLRTGDLENAFQAHPEIAFQMIQFMGRQLRIFSSTLRDFALLDVHGKTTSTLIRLANTFGERHYETMEIELPLTVQDFSAIIGCTRESVSRVFSKLKKDKMVSLRNKRIVIHDWEQFNETYQ